MPTSGWFTLSVSHSGGGWTSVSVPDHPLAGGGQMGTCSRVYALAEYMAVVTSIIQIMTRLYGACGVG